ncbi:BMC domain-containing protein [Peptoniphilus senegalensis]|uniref:BMC domain-containing protein n=1 Tax=Peptoniphilus senegalensis TaxID=1465757 RepID=A0ABV1IZB4_9FIRM
MNRALGLIEVVGLTNAIIVADTMLKASNIKMEDVEITKGMGFVTVKVSGDVGAVKAAIDSGKSLAVSFDKFVSSKVIPRPANGLDGVFNLDKEESLEVKPEKKEEIVEKKSEPEKKISETDVKEVESKIDLSKDNKKPQNKKVTKDLKNPKTSE